MYYVSFLCLITIRITFYRELYYERKKKRFFIGSYLLAYSRGEVWEEPRRRFS